MGKKLKIKMKKKEWMKNYFKLYKTTNNFISNNKIK